MPKLPLWINPELAWVALKALERIHVARVALRFPELFECLADGRLSVTTANVIVPHLTKENADELLKSAAFGTKQEILRLVARRAAGSTSAPLLEKAEEVQARSESHAPAHVEAPKSWIQNDNSPTSAQQPTSALRGRIVTTGDGGREARFAVTRQEYETFRRVQDLLGHVVPSGDPALVYARAIEHYVTYLAKRRFGAKAVAPGNGLGASPVEDTAAAVSSAVVGTAPDAPVNGSAKRAEERIIPMMMRSHVWMRDGGCCSFVGKDGHRCGSGWRIEFDHILPLAMGGLTVPENLRLLCRAHNQFEAKRGFGEEKVNTKRELARRTRERDRVAKKAEQARAEKQKDDLKEQARAAGRKADLKQQAADSARSAKLQSRYDDVKGAMVGVGCRPKEADQYAAVVDEMPAASLEDCVRAALRAYGRPLKLRGERLARCSA